MILPRNCGMREISIMRLIRPWPAPSAGWALPEKMNCTGNFSLLTILSRRSRSVNRRCARLYVAKRRAKPMMRALGLILSMMLITAEGSPWFASHLVLKSRFTNLINLFLSVMRMFQISSSGTLNMPFHASGLLWSAKSSLPRCLA